MPLNAIWHLSTSDQSRPDRDGPLDFDLICRLSTHQADDNDAHDDDDDDDDL